MSKEECILCWLFLLIKAKMNKKYVNILFTDTSKLLAPTTQWTEYSMWSLWNVSLQTNLSLWIEVSLVCIEVVFAYFSMGLISFHLKLNSNVLTVVTVWLPELLDNIFFMFSFVLMNWNMAFCQIWQRPWFFVYFNFFFFS